MIKQFTVLVDFLGKALGPDYEVTLHDLDPENSTIVAIANGRISGRTVGSPLTNTALRFLSQKQYENSDFSLNYTGQLANGKTIRSSTMFIKDEHGKPVGLLCINFDDSHFHTLAEHLLRLVHPEEFILQHYSAVLSHAPSPEPEKLSLEERAESFHNDVDGLMRDLFDEATRDMEIPLDRLTLKERTQVIARLSEIGMFRLKGAVQFAAERLSCSQASIYRYLSKVKNEE